MHSDQCKEIEENNKMGKNRDLIKKIRDTKGTFHTKLGTEEHKMVGTLQKQKILRRGDKSIQKNYTKNVFMIQRIMVV